MSLALTGCRFAYGARTVLEDVTASFGAGELVALIGPNGAGKSTLLRVMAGLLEEMAGSCTLEGRRVSAWGRRELGRRIAFVPQQVAIEFPFTAWELVLMGRAPHTPGFFDSDEDRGAVEAAMRRTGTIELRDRDVRLLSGGERQRVLLAAALAQETEILLLDEPAAHLDLAHQLSTFRLLGELSREGRLCVTATHDLNLAARYATRVAILDGGRLAADGTPEQVLTPERLWAHFGVRATLHPEQDGRFWIHYDV